MVRPLLANFHLQLNSAHANVHSAGFHSGVFHRAVSMPSVTESLANDWGGNHGQAINLLVGQLRTTLQGMFDTITAELATATDKLAHLRRFL